ncbi:hypothetical protein EBZ38_15005 [bacterium]|nr:hypothetical protein [bacterium]
MGSGLNTHFVVQDRGTGFVRTWSGSYGTRVNSFQVHYDGTMYVVGDGTALSGPNETYVRIYASSGGDNANFLVNTSSLGINHNDVTAMVLDNSESIFVGNRRILKYLSGSYTTPIWTSSLHTPSSHIQELKLDVSGNLYSFGINVNSSITSSRSFAYYSAFPSQSNQIIKYQKTGDNDYSPTWSGSFSPQTPLTPINLLIQSEGECFSFFSYYTSSLGGSTGHNVQPVTTVLETTSSVLGPNDIYNAVVIKPKATTVRTSFNQLVPTLQGIARSGSLVVQSIYIKPFDSSSTKGLGFSTPLELYFGRNDSRGGIRLRLTTGSNFSSTGRFVTMSNQITNHCRIDYTSDGWSRVIAAYYVSASVSDTWNWVGLGSITTGMDIVYANAQLESSSAASTSSAVQNVSDYFPNFGRRNTQTQPTVRTTLSTIQSGSVPYAGRWSMLVDNNQNIYVASPSPSGSNNVSLAKLRYNSDQTGQAQYDVFKTSSQTETTVNCGLSLYEREGETRLVFQAVRGNSTGANSTSSINVFSADGTDLQLETTIQHSSSIKIEDIISHIQVASTKDFYVVTTSPSTIWKYKWDGGYNWTKQTYTYTHNNNINFF